MHTHPVVAATLFVVSGISVSALASGHCKVSETTYFSCTIAKSTKVVSLCGSTLAEVISDEAKREPWLQYRFGNIDRVELVYPKKRGGSVEKFSFESSQSNRAYNYSTSFVNNGVAYHLEWMAGTETIDAQFFGVSVANGGGFQQFPCVGSPQREFTSWGSNFSSLVTSHETRHPTR